MATLSRPSGSLLATGLTKSARAERDHQAGRDEHAEPHPCVTPPPPADHGGASRDGHEVGGAVDEVGPGASTALTVRPVMTPSPMPIATWTPTMAPTTVPIDSSPVPPMAYSTMNGERGQDDATGRGDAGGGDDADLGCGAAPGGARETPRSRRRR